MESIDRVNFLSAKSVAKRIECSRRQAARLMKAGIIPSVRIGRLVRTPEVMLERYLKELARKAGVPSEPTVSRKENGQPAANFSAQNEHSSALHASNDEE